MRGLAWLAFAVGSLVTALVCIQWLAAAGSWLSILVWPGKLALSAILVSLGFEDWKTGRIPNLGTVSLILAGGICLVARYDRGWLAPAAVWLVVIGWVVGLACWGMRIFRGGDIKLCLALLAFFPDLRFVWVLIGVIFLGSVVAIARQQGLATGARQMGAICFTAFTAGKLPAPEEIEASRRQPGGVHRYGYLFSLAGLLYLWLF